MVSVEENWDKILLKTKNDYDLTDVVYKTWLKPLEVFSVDNQIVTVLVPIEPIGLNIIEKKYKKLIEVTIEEVTGTSYEIHLVLPEDAKNLSVKPPVQMEMSIQEASQKYNLNPNYTFDTFIVGNNNRLAHSAALAVAENPGEKTYNPLFIYGGVGLGKTHLMHSIAHYILEQDPNAKVLYVTSETFMNDVIEGIRTNSMPELRAKYRKLDVLLVDDIQFISKSNATQEEFFNTFNDLRSVNHQIVISSDRHPKELEKLEERAQSRLAWGIQVDIGSPDYETRMAILRNKVKLDGIQLDEEILNYIAINIKSNIRELEGALNKLIAYSNLERTEITMDIAVQELESLIYPDASREVTPELIIEVVSDHFNISVDQLKSSDRSRNVSRPRQIAMYLCKQMTDLTLETIGKKLGGKDHTTVKHGVDKISKEYKEDESMHQTIDTIRKKINPQC